MRVLITGSGGFIGSNLITLLANVPDITLFAGSRADIDLYSRKSIREFKTVNNINAVIHCAVEGNGRDTDTALDFYNNLSMFENLYSEYCGNLFINIGSGAEYNRWNSISKKFEGAIWDDVPTDYYGLAKSIIAKRLLTLPNAINLRIFGCFYHNELPTRMIRASIENYINQRPIIIPQDRYMDFFYMEDLATVIRHFLQPSSPIRETVDMNMSYLTTPRLSDIANIINAMDDHKVDIIIENSTCGKNYSGCGLRLSRLNIQLKGMDAGIMECYKKLKQYDRANKLLH
jgi:nucleoside-diphosphate-sugar epimerase